jgi:acyl-coenzyme A synthetase/AMP-(fatty) acid ligase
MHTATPSPSPLVNAALTLLEAGAPDAIALECDDERLSYAHLRQRVRRAAGAWQALGLQSGQRVIVLAPDSIEWVVAYLGVIWAGGVAMGVNPHLGSAELASILAESAIRFVWCEEASVAPLTPVLADMSTAPGLVVQGRGPLNWPKAQAQATEIDAFLHNAEAPALWIGTSGTTGAPKGVIHAQRVTQRPQAFAQGVLGLSASDRLYASSKLFFAYALGNSLLAGLRLGATVILDRQWPDPERVQQMVARHRPSAVFCVPTLYSKMLQAGVAPSLAAHGVRHWVSAGETLPATVRAAWRDATSCAIVGGYGTSETLCLMLWGASDDGLLTPTPGTDMRWDPGADAAAAQRIWLRAPSVAIGYWKRPEAQTDGFNDGWYRPGDLFLPRDGGRLAFAGRNDDMLKISGRWVSTLWVEQALLAATGDCVAQLACVGVPTEDGLTALAVLAQATPGQRDEAARRIHAAIDALPRYRRPRWVHWLAGLPLTATDKLQRARLAELHRAALHGSSGQI